MALGQNDINYMILREWAPLTDLFSKLPSKSQSGIFQQEIKLTCVDVLPEFLALGTNIGIVYWFDRKKKDIQRLRCENPNVPITSVKLISTVDYMLACGNNIGNISIFQIPKSHPDSLPENLKPKNKQVERYTVTELHKAPITAIEWSKNGMKLFSGDKTGCIVLTEIDFYMHICKSSEILNEAYEVVQLSYNLQRLLVSTTYRSIICQRVDKWKVCQVGKKDRKVLGNFGGVIYQNGYKAADTCLYCTRPGLRVWISDIDGNVLKTLLFKELLSKECPEVPIINPISRNTRSLKPQKEPSFGILLPFNENLLITYNNDIVYILNPQEMTIMWTISHLRGVLNIAAQKDEIFVLEEDRSLIRIGYRPEPVGDNAFSSVSNTFLPITTSIKDLTIKLQTTSIIPAIPPILENSFMNTVNIHTDENLVMNAEEAQESPSELHGCDIYTQKKFDDIGKQEFNDKILFKKSKNRKKRSSMETSGTSLSSNSSEDRDLSYTRPTLMNLSTVGILPDLRSPQSINYDIEYKEKILADVLNLDKVKIVPNQSSDLEEEKHKIENDCDYKPTILQRQKSQDSEDIKDVDRPTDTGPCESKTASPANCVSTNGEKSLNNSSVSPPACVNIPNEWKLANIQIKERKVSTVSDTSLSDWEFV
ncbi:WD repeat-containing protein CG11141 [Anoplophora glabripennis]|nr:WD repeat-containing protein CG11141 [Anoplophora glabripennis]